ncbi:hypothetical protein ACF1GW_39220, partial [Streptomyces achromogenes]|uniref:hypothetical protein n=1 Tax=Streptomyces achromogenes TaxID=67255 RepID=UPI0036FF1527
MEDDGDIATLAPARTDAESYANARFIAHARTDITAMADEIRRLRAELAAAVRVSEALHRRLSEEQLAGSALYAALTMPTSQEQRQAALDKFTAVAQQVSGAETRPAVETHV